MPHDLCMFKFMIMFALCFTMGKVHRRGTFPKCRAELGWLLHHPRPPLFWECGTLPGGLPQTNHLDPKIPKAFLCALLRELLAF